MNNTNNKNISAILCSLSFLKQSKQTSKTDILSDVKIMPPTTTSKVNKFFVIIYKMQKKKTPRLNCTCISNVAFLITHKSKMNYSINNNYREEDIHKCTSAHNMFQST